MEDCLYDRNTGRKLENQFEQYDKEEHLYNIIIGLDYLMIKFVRILFNLL